MQTDACKSPSGGMRSVPRTTKKVPFPPGFGPGLAPGLPVVRPSPRSSPRPSASARAVSLANKLGNRIPWLNLISDVNIKIFLTGSYFLPNLYGSPRNRQWGRKIGETFHSLLENNFYSLHDLSLRLDRQGGFDEYLSSLPKCNIYHPMWNSESFTTGAIIPYYRSELGEIVVGLSVSTYSSLTYLGGTREKNEYILYTTVREFEEETTSRAGAHFLEPISVAQLHGKPYVMDRHHRVVLFFVEVFKNPDKIRQHAVSAKNPETAGIMWLTWSQLTLLLHLARNPTEIKENAFWPFLLSAKLREAFRETIE